MPRLQALYLGRNRITTISTGLGKSIGNLHTLVLSQNQISELADLEPLAELKKLTHLALLENPVTSKEVCNAEVVVRALEKTLIRCQNYRYWVIARCPTVRFLDFQKVKDSERSKAAELFGTIAEPSEAAQTVCTCSPPATFARFALIIIHRFWPTAPASPLLSMHRAPMAQARRTASNLMIGKRLALRSSSGTPNPWLRSRG